jgi:hypothetical protein
VIRSRSLVRNREVAYDRAVDREEQIRSLYASFNARDVDAVLADMTDDVDWPNAWEGGSLRGREAIREYWQRQWAEIDPHVEPVSVSSRGDGRLAVQVRQTVRDRQGRLLGESDVVHVYDFRDDRISRMVVEEGDS